VAVNDLSLSIPFLAIQRITLLHFGFASITLLLSVVMLPCAAFCFQLSSLSLPFCQIGFALLAYIYKFRFP
jgi:hypothetical protein